MLQDRLKLNDDKTEFIVIGTRQQLAKVNVDSLQVGESTVTANLVPRLSLLCLQREAEEREPGTRLSYSSQHSKKSRLLVR